VALDGYWRDLGQPHYYLRAHRELLRDDVGVLDVPGWPILTRRASRAPARVLDGGEVVDGLLSPGCVVSGRVERGVLGPGVRVEAGARVRDAVLFDDVTVEAGATVSWAIVDKRCRVGRGAGVGSDDADLDDSDDIVLLGDDAGTTEDLMSCLRQQLAEREIETADDAWLEHTVERIRHDRNYMIDGEPDDFVPRHDR
jgi:glucose-1-phosphate adenylyltransferase